MLRILGGGRAGREAHRFTAAAILNICGRCIVVAQRVGRSFFGHALRSDEEAAVKVGFVGPGGMGSAMAVNLLKAGHQVKVWSRRPEPADRLRELGAHVVDSPHAAFQGDAFVSMRPFSPILGAWSSERRLWGRDANRARAAVQR